MVYSIIRRQVADNQSKKLKQERSCSSLKIPDIVIGIVFGFLRIEEQALVNLGRHGGSKSLIVNSVVINYSMSNIINKKIIKVDKPKKLSYENEKSSQSRPRKKTTFFY